MRTLAIWLLLVAAASAQVSFELAPDPGLTAIVDAWKAQMATPWFWGATAIDYDNDGDSDVVLTIHSGGATGVPDSILCRNNFVPSGALSFTDVTASAFGAGVKTWNTNKPHVWDVNDDGKWDLVCGSVGKTWINNGDGTFTSNGQQVRGMERDITLGDLNADGKVDFYAPYLDNVYAVSKRTTGLNGNNGVFAVSTTTLTLPAGLPSTVTDRLAASVAAVTSSYNRYRGANYLEADINGDARKDVLVWFGGSYQGDTWMFLCLRQADDSLVDVTASAGLTSEGCRPFSAKDVNSDGLLDLLVTPGGVAKSGLWIQGANGVFSNSANPGIADYLKDATAYTPHEWWEDFDHDGDPDLAVSLMRTTTAKVWANDGAGVFTQLLTLKHWDADGVQIRSRAGHPVDFNNDGLTDILVAGADGKDTTKVDCWINTSIVPDDPPPPPPPPPPPAPTGVIRVKVNGTELLPGTTVKIDGVLISPPEGEDDKIIEVDEPAAQALPTPTYDPESLNFKRWLTYINGMTSKSAWQYALAYRATKSGEHRAKAIELAAAIVSADTVAGDQYLGSGAAYRDVFSTLAWCQPTEEQAASWLAWGKRHLGKPDGSVRESIWWSSRWARNNPANNYYHSFITATSYYVMATGDAEWKAFLKEDRLPKLTAYYATTPEGGSREGTGYGESHRSLFDLAKLWRDYDRTEILPREFINGSLHYWTHATTPGHGWVALIGDQTRTHGKTDGYHRHIVSAALALADDTEAIAVGRWQLSKLPPPKSAVFYALELTNQPAGEAPKSLEYHAKSVGHYFTRTSWEADASYLHCVAGRFDEAHAQQDQGSFAVFAAGRWQTCSDSPWTHGGTSQAVDYQNVVRFGIAQKKQTTATLTAAKGVIDMDLSEPAQRPWKRRVAWTGESPLVVRDWCDPTATFGFCKPSEDDTREPYVSLATVAVEKLADGFSAKVVW